MRNKICFGKSRVKYMIDSIIEEIHKIREEYAEKFDYDVDAMFDDLCQKQSQSDHKIMSFAVDKVKRISEEKKVG
jgi:hypothetical protein